MVRRDGFKDGIFWETYMDLERQFIQFLDQVPYLKGNEKTYSFRLMNMLTSFGGYIDSALKEIERYPKYKRKFEEKKAFLEAERKKKGEELKPGFRNYYLDVIDDIYKLKDKKVEFKRLPRRQQVQPYENTDWWNIYNSVKHDLGQNLKKANLENTMKALSASFLINAVHEPSILRLYHYDVLTCCINRKPRYRPLSAYLPENALLEMLKRKQELPSKLETELFVYCYES